jgi:hypothetical protein
MTLGIECNQFACKCRIALATTLNRPVDKDEITALGPAVLSQHLVKDLSIRRRRWMSQGQLAKHPDASKRRCLPDSWKREEDEAYADKLD